MGAERMCGSQECLHLSSAQILVKLMKPYVSLCIVRLSMASRRDAPLDVTPWCPRSSPCMGAEWVWLSGMLAVIFCLNPTKAY